MLVAMSTYAAAWSYEGHLLSAGVARCLLKHSDPDLLERTEDILSVLHNDQTRHERDHIFVESAVFADIIKREGG